MIMCGDWSTFMAGEVIGRLDETKWNPGWGDITRPGLRCASSGLPCSKIDNLRRNSHDHDDGTHNERPISARVIVPYFHGFNGFLDAGTIKLVPVSGMTM